jgi:hypothetical protein
MAFRANRNLAFTNIRVLMVSAFRLARRSPIVSRPPENIRSTATADPVDKEIWKSALRYLDYAKEFDAPGMQRTLRTSRYK